ncbi:MAG: hypothetical protein PHZ26_03970 [Candidatus Gracilibacteria bacterium]|nr:hypothetical protein [Candidatus Gracilibacteria bacterium]MDD2908885.1 hypothetical protein [Candidatus Gracilibacteria bacterium]
MVKCIAKQALKSLWIYVPALIFIWSTDINMSLYDYLCLALVCFGFYGLIEAIIMGINMYAKSLKEDAEKIAKS